MLVLREHQQEVIDKLREGFQQGHKRQLLYAATGFGKSEVAAYIMQETAKNYKRAAMIVDRIVLAEQTSLRLAKYSIPHGVMQSQHWRYRPYEAIQVCSAQTLEKRKHFPETSLVILDECHVQRRGTIEWIKNHPETHVIGLTATPFTSGLGSVYTNVVSATPTGKLVDKGWLCPLRVYVAKEIDMAGAKKVAGEWSQGAATERGMQITGDVVAEWVKKTHEVFGGPKKTIVFCSGVDHGRDLEKQFKAAGYNFVSISYKEEDEFKRETIEEFSKADTTIHGLIATDILTRGFDVPDVMIGVSARPFSKSLSSHVQQMGRVMRPYEGKEFGIWIDHSGNYLRFRDDWEDVYDNGVSTLSEGGEKAKSEPTEREKKESKCPSCSALWVRGTDTCPYCGHVKIRIAQVQSVPGELIELNAAGTKKSVDNREFYRQLLHYSKSRGYKDGWAAYKYKEKYHTFPPRAWGNDPIMIPSLATTNWIRSRMIAYSKRKTA